MKERIQQRKLERARDLIQKALAMIASEDLVVYITPEKVLFVKEPIFEADDQGNMNPVYENVRLEFPSSMRGGGY